MPLSGFRLYDDLVIVESIVGEQQLAEPNDVARYEKYLELLREAASIGSEAAAIIQRSLQALRASRDTRPHYHGERAEAATALILPTRDRAVITDALWTQTAREQPRMGSTDLYIESAPTCRYATWRDQPLLAPTAC